MSIDQVVACRILGKGEDLVLLHGWGTNSFIWQKVELSLGQHFRVHLIDLPGFGSSSALSTYTLSSMLEAIVKVVPDQAIWCGWSLGGLLATYASYAYPHKVKKLIQVCSALKFVSENAFEGVDSAIFENFKMNLKKNKDKTLKRFMSFQTQGPSTAREDIRSMKSSLGVSFVANEAALLGGLCLLQETDLRECFTQIKQPCLSIFGAYDALIPKQGITQIKILLAHSQQVIFEKSAHAPFISEREYFCRLIKAL